MNKLIIAAIIAGLSGSVFAEVGGSLVDLQVDRGNRGGTSKMFISSSGAYESDLFADRGNRAGTSKVFLSSTQGITGSQPEIGGTFEYDLFADRGNRSGRN